VTLIVNHSNLRILQQGSLTERITTVFNTLSELDVLQLLMLGTHL